MLVCMVVHLYDHDSPASRNFRIVFASSTHEITYSNPPKIIKMEEYSEI